MLKKELYTILTTELWYGISCNYIDVGGIKYHGCPPIREILHSLKLVVYLHVQADKRRYNNKVVWQFGKRYLVIAFCQKETIYNCQRHKNYNAAAFDWIT